jgi:hypothetical protein
MRRQRGHIEDSDVVLEADADARDDGFAGDFPHICAHAWSPDNCRRHQLEECVHGRLKASRREFRVDDSLLGVKHLDHEVTLVKPREFPFAWESHQRDVDIPAHSAPFTEFTQLTAAPRGQLQTVRHPSGRHTLEQTKDSVALGILPVRSDAVKGGHRYARHGADCPRRSLCPACRDSHDQVLPYRGEGSTRSDGIDSDGQTLWAIVITSNPPSRAKLCRLSMGRIRDERPYRWFRSPLPKEEQALVRSRSHRAYVFVNNGGARVASSAPGLQGEA